MTDPVPPRPDATQGTPRPSAGQVIREVAKELARRAEAQGHRPLAEHLRADLARHDQADTTVVVVGETKRGKSSLVNALVGRPGLSPVDADIATSTYLVIRHNDAEAAVVHHDGGEQRVPLEDLPRWATSGAGRMVSAVEVGLDRPLLARGLTLIDTPGVGGLEASHREVTLAALVRADALLYVLDPDAPLSRPERQFLSSVTERLGTVIFALTKVDLYPAWRSIEAADRQALREVSPRFADSPFVPVSSAVKEEADALAADNHPAASELLEESGFPALEAELESGVIARGRALRLGNLASHCRSALARLALPDRVDSSAGDPALETELEAATARQEEFRRSERSWPANLNAQLETLRVQLDAEYERSVAELSRVYEERILTTKESAEEWLPAALEAELRALAARLDAFLQGGLAEVLARLLEEFGAREVLLGSVTSMVRLSEEVGLPPLDPSATAAEGMSRGQRIMEYGRGGSLGAVLGARVVDLVLPGVGLLLGTGAGLLLARVNISLGKSRTERLADRQHAVKFLQRVLGPVARTEVRAPLQARWAAIRRDVTEEVRARLEERSQELQSALAQQRRLMQETEAERRRFKVEADRRLAELDALSRRLGAAERALGSVGTS